MIRAIFLTLIPLTFFLHYGCKEDEPIEPPQCCTTSDTSAKIITVETGEEYGKQIFFNLITGKSVADNDLNDWDIAIQNEVPHRIMLNYSRLVQTATTEKQKLSDVRSTSGLEFSIDAINGNLDSTAFGDWDSSKVYVIDLGVSANAKKFGHRKLRINLIDKELTISFAAISDSTHITLTHQLGNGKFTYVSLLNEDFPEIEPINDEWHLQFTRYSEVFYIPSPLEYLVTGALINSFLVEVAEDSVSDFKFIDEIPNVEQFSTHRDVIGYDWKQFDRNENIFNIKTYKNYILHLSKDSKTYKLRFLDFYNEDGEKGSYVFEYQLI